MGVLKPIENLHNWIIGSQFNLTLNSLFHNLTI